MGDCETRTISDQNFITACIWLMQRQVSKVACNVMRHSTIQKPIVHRVLRSNRYIRSWLPMLKGIALSYLITGVA